MDAPRTRAQLLAGDLEKQILAGNFAPGEMIGTIDGLRARTGFARSTVAEAVGLLTDRGLMEIRPGRSGGLFASAPGPMVRLGRTLLSVSDEPTSVAEAIAVREALEVLIDTDAAKHRTDADVADLERLHRRLDEVAAVDRTQFMLANWDLHERIARISTNATASTLYVSMTRLVREHSVAATHDDDPESAREWLRLRVEIHGELVQAIGAGDVERTRAAADRHAGLLIAAP